MTSFEDDILASVETRLANTSTVTSFVGSVVTTAPITVKRDGASVAIPAIKLASASLSVGSRVAVLLIGAQYVVIGVISV